MSLAEKCDICGQFTEPYLTKVHIAGIILQHFDLRDRGWDNDLGNRLHICEDCYKSIEEHIGRLRHESITEDKNERR